SEETLLDSSDEGETEVGVDRGLVSAELVVGCDVLGDGLSGGASARSVGLDRSLDHGGVSGVRSRLLFGLGLGCLGGLLGGSSSGGRHRSME
ncbi:hypothetical protein PMAYCL1PPCAC_31180, partial [Pristionchus mayeri]